MIFNLEAIKEEFEGVEVQENYDGGKEKWVFLGTVFNLMPSGKFYMPWACSNLEPCRICKGSGKARREVDCLQCGGLGERIAYAGFNLPYISEREGRDVKVGDRFKCLSCDGSGKMHPDCRWCGGIGSREAYLDERWRERAEKELEKIGASLCSGEGDPCDLFAVIQVEEEE